VPFFILFQPPKESRTASGAVFRNPVSVQRSPPRFEPGLPPLPPPQFTLVQLFFLHAELILPSPIQQGPALNFPSFFTRLFDVFGAPLSELSKYVRRSPSRDLLLFSQRLPACPPWKRTDFASLSLAPQPLE